MAASNERGQYERDYARFRCQQDEITDERYRINSKIEQLKRVSELSAIVGGFAGAYLAQVSIPSDNSVSEGVLVAFGGMAALTVGLSVVSVVLTSVIMMAVLNNSDSFDTFWRENCESNWNIAYKCFLLAVPFLLVTTVLCGWVQFRASIASSSLVTALPLLTVTFGCVYILPKWRHSRQ